MNLTIARSPKRHRITTSLIHSGDITHIHDQLILSVNLSPIKRTERSTLKRAMKLNDLLSIVVYFRFFN